MADGDFAPEHCFTGPAYRNCLAVKTFNLKSAAKLHISKNIFQIYKRFSIFFDHHFYVI